ncbi:sigma-54-dependent transcriptional regulator [Pontiella agarivorans]|uniref:Sigma-54 dependent transcriptional regulator n=1 Tax=Pontiella agarivorans TaxID=3038953 RepID=A0ABU5MSS8_9BACT|nr:sigma-54 dependent transcriptional regulator [Pontiella agarivorans]MDZ8117261.1 sigma-54 dependent transcriptional regulator [Pontiella agarivorans]
MGKTESFTDIKVLVVEDDDLLRRVMYDRLTASECEVMAADSLHDAHRLLASASFDIMITDIRLPDGSGLDLLEEQREAAPEMAIVVMTAFADVDTAVSALKQGAFDYLSKPFEDEQLYKILRNLKDKSKLTRKVETLKDYSLREFEGFVQFDQMIGTSAMTEIFNMAGRVAKSGATVLILGESGAGKGMLSKAIHRSSPRVKEPFVEINCSAIPEHLLESELFGYESGAFTDAKNKKLGLFEVAEGGTIFLDEIGDMDLALQAKVLKVLEDREFRRLGALRPTQVDVRIIAATNRNLKELVKEGTFREDLFYRLSVVPIKVPPLRNHPNSIEPMANYFLQLFAKQMGRVVQGFEADALSMLRAYNWPGNVRELRNVIERGLILSDGDYIKASALNLDVGAAPASAEEGSNLTELLPLAEIEKRHIKRVLKTLEGNRKAAAEVLQIHRTTLYKKIEVYELG